MCDRKALIKNEGMSEEMQQDSVECATQALEKYNTEKDIAAHTEKDLRLYLFSISYFCAPCFFFSQSIPLKNKCWRCKKRKKEKRVDSGNKTLI
uniref:Dynein light chain n=1 Tax=Sciurus vulgaris TaxID=55149 RepID=A0A8D2AIZ5_SCIVU